MKKRGFVRALGILVLPLSLRLVACGGESGHRAPQGNDPGGSGGQDAGSDAGAESDADAGSGAHAGNAAGSTSTPPRELGIVSGSRLKQVWFRGGGAALPRHTVDTELDAECSFETAADGTLRCLPTTGTAVVFSDSDCGNALLLSYPNAECEAVAPRFGKLRGPGEDCAGDRTRVFEAEGAADAPEALYEMLDGECVSRSLNDGAEYTSAAEADPDAFVSGERVVDDRSEQVGVQWIHSADDGWFPEGMVNLARGEACQALEQTEGDAPGYYCVSNPAFAYEEGNYGYTDSSCESLAANVNDSCVATEAVLSTARDDDGCFTHSVHEPGEELTTIYESTEDGCTEATVNLGPNTQRIAMGPPAKKLVELTPENGPTSGRLAIQVYASGAALVSVRANVLWDTEHEAPCSPMPLEDGVTVCVPGPFVTIGASSSDNTYRDSECTQRIVPGYDLKCTGEAEFRFITYQSDDFCAPATRTDIYEAGASFTTDTVYVGSGADCFASATNPNTIWVERGAEVILEEAFVVLSEERD